MIVVNGKGDTFFDRENMGHREREVKFEIVIK
jgi:hypothetical protein